MSQMKPKHWAYAVFYAVFVTYSAASGWDFFLNLSLIPDYNLLSLILGWDCAIDMAKDVSYITAKLDGNMTQREMFNTAFMSENATETDRQVVNRIYNKPCDMQGNIEYADKLYTNETE